jgi:hypothetical protein
MKSVEQTHAELVEAERAAYISALDEVERSAFLLSILNDTGHSDPGEESSEIHEATPASDEAELAIAMTASSDTSAPVKLTKALAFKKNFRARCGCDQVGTCNSESHGTSYVDMDYNHGVGRGKHDVVCYIRHYGVDVYGTGPNMWAKFMNASKSARLFQSARLFGPGSPGRGGYFGSGNNQTAGRHTGTLGLAVYKPGTNDLEYWACYCFTAGWGDWGDQWLRCGHTYNFWFADA